ncbi:MAG TPA: HD domain-containing phosphohydrolase [Planctomycetota bacterium]|nr:HD domain-containing phosphohydrolase [Planctomycetota bacterium]
MEEEASSSNARVEVAYRHLDRLARLDESVSLSEKLEAVFQALREPFPFIARVAVASYDQGLGTLRTFLASSGPDRPLVRYESRLDHAPSLAEILRRGRPRVINDLELLARGPHEHTQAIRRQGYRASYTMPIRFQGGFWGFVFFNSYEPGPFTEEVLAALDPFGHLVAALTVAELLSVRVLAAAVRTAHAMVHLRDPETGAHLNRMAEYARIIAGDLAHRGRVDFDDETVERLHLFAPLHDLGKIGIPDRLLLKAGRLSTEEREEMKTHSAKGLEMIDRIMANFGLEHLPGAEMLRNVAAAHHEALDGSGYPHGLKGREIPIEARIVSVADVFDALTSPRPYKESWSNDQAFAHLQRLAADKLDADCVEALVRHRPRIEELQARFRDVHTESPGSSPPGGHP